MSERIRITREEFVKAMVEIVAPPKALVSKLDKPPLCHLLSTYVIRPVASDENPFLIHHKNKQPVFVQNKKFNKYAQNEEAPFKKNDGEESSSDDEFEKVKTDKKRVRKPQNFISRSDAMPQNSEFPASDPAKVKIIERRAKEEKEEPKEETPTVVEEPPKKVEEKKPAPVEVKKEASAKV